MELIIVRHGHAVDVGEPGVTEDADRYLTEEGKQKGSRAAEFLAAKLQSVDNIYTSPLIRARQTADILGDALNAVIMEVPCLEPGEWQTGKGVLSALKGDCCLLVGHNPDLEELASFCLGGAGHDFIELKKAGVCWIAFEGRPAEGEGILRMLLTPASLSR